jgi:4-hydroxy-tetrahydrodipicolinate synthase
MFEGAYTALVTPFNKDGSVDYGKLRALIAMQIEGGMDGIVPVGTTGESPTLDFDEHEKVVEVSVEASRGKLKVIAGTGANSTSEALQLTKHALKAGADGTLQVTPYYNKPNQEGLYRHFSAVADLGLPVVLYNVPGRSARDIDVATIARLAKHPKVVAVKEAAGSVDRVSQILRACSITVLSGDDSLTLPMMAVGGSGVISVASNIAPRPVADLVHAAQAGQWDKARALHMKYHRLFTDLFLDTNPIPIKAAMAMAGMIEEVYRLPLCETSEAIRKKLAECLKEVGLLG